MYIVEVDKSKVHSFKIRIFEYGKLTYEEFHVGNGWMNDAEDN